MAERPRTAHKSRNRVKPADEVELPEVFQVPDNPINSDDESSVSFHNEYAQGESKLNAWMNMWLHSLIEAHYPCICVLYNVYR